MQRKQTRVQTCAWQIYPKIAILERFAVEDLLQIPRFRKNEGGVDEFAEGYKTFGFQRQDWCRSKPQVYFVLSCLNSVVISWYYSNDTTCILNLCLYAFTQFSQARVRTEMDVYGVASCSERSISNWWVQQLGHLAQKCGKHLWETFPLMNLLLQIGFEGCRKKFCTPASQEGSMLKWQVDLQSLPRKIHTLSSQAEW